MPLCPVLCHSPKLRMEIAGTKVAITGGHLDSRVTQDAAQVVKIAPALDEPASNVWRKSCHLKSVRPARWRAATKPFFISTNRLPSAFANRYGLFGLCG